MASHELAYECVGKLEVNFGNNFGRDKAHAPKFVQLLIDRLTACSDEVCRDATDRLLTNCQKRHLMIDRVAQAIRLAEQSHRKPDYYCPDFEGTFRCRACEDSGVTAAYVVREHQRVLVLYEMAERCRADGCEAADRMAHIGRVETCQRYEVVARFDRTQLSEEMEFRQSWWQHHTDTLILVPPNHAPQGKPPGERMPRRFSAVLPQP